MSDLILFYNTVDLYREFPARKIRDSIDKLANDLISRGVISSDLVQTIINTLTVN